MLMVRLKVAILCRFVSIFVDVNTRESRCVTAFKNRSTPFAVAAMATTDVEAGDCPTVSVIVPVRNDAGRLRECLTLLKNQNYPADKYEVIVVNNASEDNVSAILPADSRFRLIYERRRGSYAARNAGVAVATGQILAFTDSDCLPRPDWIRCGVAALGRKSPPDAIGGAVEMIFRNGSHPETGPEYYDALDGLPQQKHFIEEYPFAATANMFVRAASFHAVGAFDSALLSSGDREWGMRLAAAGGVFAYAAEAVVDHPTRSTWQEMTAKALRISRGVAQLEATAPVGSVLYGIIGEGFSACFLYREFLELKPAPRAVLKFTTAAAFFWARTLRISIRLGRLLQRAFPKRLGARKSTFFPQ